MIDTQHVGYWKSANLPTKKPFARNSARTLIFPDDDYNNGGNSNGNLSSVPFGLPTYDEICKALNKHVTMKETAKLWNPISNRKYH